MAETSCGIFIGPAEIRAVTVKRARKGYRLAGFRVAELSPDDRAKPGPRLRAMMKKIKGSPKRAVICLPKEQAILNHVTFPTNNPEELQSMARFEAERQIPFNAERHGVGFQVLRDRELEGADVLLAAVDEPHIERAMEAVRATSIRSKGLNISSACLINAALHAHPKLVRNKCVVIMSVGVDSLDLVFCVQGRLLFSRSVPNGLRKLVEALSPASAGGQMELDRARIGAAARSIDMNNLDALGKGGGLSGEGDPTGGPAKAARDWGQGLIQDLRRSYDYVRREMGCPDVEGLILAGEGAIIRNLAQYLFVNLNIEVAMLNPVAQMKKAKLKGLPFAGLELTVPFGAAIQDAVEGGYTLDLTPPVYYERVVRRRLYRNLVFSGVLFVATSAIGVAAYSEWQSGRRAMVDLYQAATREMRPHVKDLEDSKEKLLILEKFMEDPTNALTVLNCIAAFPGIKNRVTITEVSYDKGDRVMIKGDAKTTEDVNNFFEHLRRSGLFGVGGVSREQGVNARQSNRNIPEFYKFTMTCEIPPYHVTPREFVVAEDQPPARARSAPPQPAQPAGAPAAAKTLEAKNSTSVQALRAEQARQRRAAPQAAPSKGADQRPGGGSATPARRQAANQKPAAGAPPRAINPLLPANRASAARPRRPASRTETTP